MLIAGNRACHLEITTDANVWEKANFVWSSKRTTVIKAAYKNSQVGDTGKRDVGHCPWQGLWVLF